MATVSKTARRRRKVIRTAATVKQLSTPPTPSAESPVVIEEKLPKFAMPGEAAVYLRVSKASIFNWIKQGKIPAVRFGNAVRIPWAFLLKQDAA